MPTRHRLAMASPPQMQGGEPRSLLDAFDTLEAAQARARARAPRMPFLIITAIVALLAGLFVALMVEQHQVQRDALARDVDAAARQLGLRLDAIAESLVALALELSTAANPVQRFRQRGAELLSTKHELVRVQYIDDAGRALAQVDAVPLSSEPAPLGATLETALNHARAAGTPTYTHAFDDAARLAVIVPLPSARGRALIGRIDASVFLMQVVAPETIDRYRIALLAGEHTLASNAMLPPTEASGLRYATTVSPLPPEVKLLAVAYRADAPLLRDALVWVVAGLAAAVIVALASLARYTTRQWKLDRALLAETALRRAMEDSLAVGLRVLDMQGVIRYVNRAFCQMSGWPATALVGRTAPFPYWAPEDAQRNGQALAAMLAGGAPADAVEVVVCRPDGSRFDSQMHSTPLVDGSGRQIGWMTSMIDVTEQRRVRMELAAAHERLKTVLESLEAAVSVVSIDSGDLLFANRAYRERFGADASGHRRLHAALRQRDSDEVFDAATGLWLDVRTRTIEWPAKTVTGGAAERTDRARLQIASDITLRKAAEENARQQQEKVHFTARLTTLGEMASSLAHELNQPLAAITNYSEGTLARARDGTLSNTELQQALAKLAQQAQRAAGIIRRIREFVKRSEPRRQPTPAARIVEDAIAFAQIEADKKGIAIRSHIEPDLPPLDVDAILIEQVLLNLLKNAIDAMQQATVRRIDVEVTSGPSGQAEVRVIDRGTGIHAEQRTRLFEPFFSTKPDGMGMGLNICRSIVEFHHGRIAIETNPEPTGGTVVRFTLPLALETELLRP
ncbi:MAG: PAS domain S-box protein [Burkholderiaceae bacterium]|nr:PAS domain S-box protein [Burkholderiaceae bacterium]